jgi:Ran GTPase-activating protein (RanGAP) involved in mRNA processing and transport
MATTDNNIGDEGAKSIVEALKHNSTLQSLNFYSTELTFHHFVTHSGTTGNNIGDEGAKSIAEALKHNTTLQSFNFYGT